MSAPARYPFASPRPVHLALSRLARPADARVLRLAPPPYRPRCASPACLRPSVFFFRPAFFPYLSVPSSPFFPSSRPVAVPRWRDCPPLSLASPSSRWWFPPFPPGPSLHVLPCNSGFTSPSHAAFLEERERVCHAHARPPAALRLGPGANFRARLTLSLRRLWPRSLRCRRLIRDQIRVLLLL